MIQRRQTLMGGVLRFALIAFAAAGCAPNNVRAIDLRLYVKIVQEDGNTLERSYLQYDRDNIVYFEPPRTWSVTSNAQVLTAAPKNIANSEIKIENSALSPNLPFKDQGLETYKRAVRTMVPQEATNVVNTSEAPDPLPVFGWTSYEFVVGYDLLGTSYKRSIVFVNVSAKEQLIASAVAPTKNFDEIRKSSLRTMRSWCPASAK